MTWPSKINCASVVLQISSILVFTYLTYETIRTITAYTVLLPGDDPGLTGLCSESFTPEEGDAFALRDLTSSRKETA